MASNLDKLSFTRIDDMKKGTRTVVMLVGTCQIHFHVSWDDLPEVPVVQLLFLLTFTRTCSKDQILRRKTIG